MHPPILSWHKAKESLSTASIPRAPSCNTSGAITLSGLDPGSSTWADSSTSHPRPPISMSLKRDGYVLPQAPNPPSVRPGAFSGVAFGASDFWSRVGSGSLVASLPSCWRLGSPSIPFSYSIGIILIGDIRGIPNCQPNSYGRCRYGAAPLSSSKGVRRFGFSSRLRAPPVEEKSPYRQAARIRRIPPFPTIQ